MCGGVNAAHDGARGKARARARARAGVREKNYR